MHFTYTKIKIILGYITILYVVRYNIYSLLGLLGLLDILLFYTLAAVVLDLENI